YPAPTDIAVQIYNRATIPTMWAKLHSGQSIPQVIAWAKQEVEGFIRRPVVAVPGLDPGRATTVEIVALPGLNPGGCPGDASCGPPSSAEPTNGVRQEEAGP